MNIPPKYEDVVAKLDAALAREDALQALSVTRIMLDVVPGEDGMGEEIYSKSVADVEALLSKQCEDIEALQDREDALRDELAGANRRLGVCINQIEEQQQRLTVAEQRETELIGLLKLSLLAVDDVAENCEDQADWATANSMHALSKRITAALKPAEGEGS